MVKGTATKFAVIISLFDAAMLTKMIDGEPNDIPMFGETPDGRHIELTTIMSFGSRTSTVWEGASIDSESRRVSMVSVDYIGVYRESFGESEVVSFAGDEWKNW